MLVDIKSIKETIINKRESYYTVIVFAGCVLTAILMIIRCFYGTELTDEAFYVAEAKEILNGNIPYAYNNYSVAVGFSFILVVFEYIYRFFVPNLEGIFLATRLFFVFTKIIISGIVYLVLKKGLKKADALLLIGILIPMTGAISLQNFSYNTIPVWLFFLSGILLYDVLEQEVRHKKIEVCFAGLLAGIGCFANPGWGLSLVVFLLLILIRVKNKKEKIITLSLFFGAIFTVVIIVVVPIIIKTSISEFLYGTDKMFFHKIPRDLLCPEPTIGKIIRSFKKPLLNRFELLAWAPLIYLFSYFFITENGKKLSKKQYICLALSITFFLDIFFVVYKSVGVDKSYIWAFTAFIYILIFICLGFYKNEKIIWYLGVCPVVFSIAEVLLVEFNASIVRFIASFTIVIPLLYIMLKQRTVLIRAFATMTAVTFIIAIGYASYHYMYRDAGIKTLKYKVESGVYKGIYTTKTRARDLPSLEQCLNELIKDGETYSFRDNVPCAYLMAHTGKGCELSTWDAMQYTYKCNSPAIMFDYYQRRDMIPEKIIYIDYGRDKTLSIQDSSFRYNDWVNSYYNLTSDFKLNDTFKHIMVYQYNGSFNGDYQYWIDTYYPLIDNREKK